MQFKTDENLPVEISEILLNVGHDAKTVNDQQLKGTKDEVLIDICKNENRALITLDTDFSEFNEFPELSELIKSENYVLRDLFFEYDVPMKGGYCIRMHTLNWRWNLIVEKGTRSLFPQSTLEDVTVKQNNSLEYAKQFVSTGRIYMQNQDKIPVELRSMWRGAKEPPFKHGDEL